MKTITKEYFKYVSRNIAGMLGLSAYILADTFFVAKGLGIDGLAALNFAISIYAVINGIGLMLGVGGGSNYSFLKSKNEDNRADKIFTTTLILGLLFGLVLFIIGVTMPSMIAKLLGAEGNIHRLTTQYLRVILMFSPAFILNNILISFVRNDNSPTLSMTAMLVGSFSNIILDYIFVFPLNMGIYGAAIATGIAPILSILVLSSHLIKKNNGFHFIKTKLKITLSQKILMQGTSSLITEVASSVSLIVFNIIILKVSGKVGVAAYGVVANISIVVISIFTGIAQGIQPLISKNYGKQRLKEIKSILKYGILTSIILSIFIYILSYIFAGEIIAVFNSENNIQLARIAEKGIKIYFIGFIFAGLNIVMISYYNSINKSNIAFILSLLRGVILIVPIVLIMSHLFGINGVWITFILTEILTFVAVFLNNK